MDPQYKKGALDDVARKLANSSFTPNRVFQTPENLKELQERYKAEIELAANALHIAAQLNAMRLNMILNKGD